MSHPCPFSLHSSPAHKSSRQEYKRAVLRNPPKQFNASVLPTKKLGTSIRPNPAPKHQRKKKKTGSGWVYGLRVIATADEEGPDRRSVSSRSTNSGKSNRDYEVWRRWEDCLWFQENLELEYSISAREKRRRLEQGKGVKKNGIYLDSKQAASFESLPPGPDPTSVSLDLHRYIPKLTKKSTLFRANQATLDQRQHQFAEFINAWFTPQLPVLIAELRDSNAFRDFFGWWRRDKDFKRKYGPGKGKNPETPITTDPKSFYLDDSNASEFFPSPTTLSPTSPLSRSKSTRSATIDVESRRYASTSHSREDSSSRRRRATSAASSSPTIAIAHQPTVTSHDSRPSSIYSAELSPTVLMWDGHQHLSASDRVSPNSVLDAFPQTPMVRETFENIQYPPSPEPDSPVLGIEALPEGFELDISLSKISLQEDDDDDDEPRTPCLVTSSYGNPSVPDGRHRNGVAFSGTASDDPTLSDIPKSSPTMTNTTGASSRHSLFSNNSMVPSWRTSASDLLPSPSPRRSLESCTTDTVDYSSTGSPVSPQTPWFSDGEPLPTFGKRNPRDSVWSINSINSVMSDYSVDQVLPRGTCAATRNQPGENISLTRISTAGHRHRSNKFAPMSAPGESTYLEDCDEEMLDSYLYGERPLPVLSPRLPFYLLCL